MAPFVLVEIRAGAISGDKTWGFGSEDFGE